jgi:RNA polymerase primary sigma factor
MNQYANDFTSTVRIYYNDLKKYKPLSRSKEKKLLKLCKKGDEKAKNELLESNLKFVFDVAKRYTGRGVPISELISEGNMGLIKAIDKFDETQDVKFISYAVWWIRHAMLEAIRKNKLINYVELDTENGNNETIEKKVSDNEDEKVSSSELMFSNEYEEKKREINNEQKKIISNLLMLLTQREKFVIENYYGINNKNELTLNEIGIELKISSERVRQVKKQALKKLRSKVMLYNDIDDIFN